MPFHDDLHEARAAMYRTIPKMVRTLVSCRTTAAPPSVAKQSRRPDWRGRTLTDTDDRSTTTSICTRARSLVLAHDDPSTRTCRLVVVVVLGAACDGAARVFDQAAGTVRHDTTVIGGCVISTARLRLPGKVVPWSSLRSLRRAHTLHSHRRPSPRCLQILERPTDVYGGRFGMAAQWRACSWILAL